MSQIFDRRSFLTLALIVAAGPALAADAAEDYVQSVADGVLGAARSGSVARFKSLLRANADIPAIALFSLGSYRKNLAASQQAEYFSLVENFISRVFADHAAKLAGTSLVIKGSQSAGDSVLVKSQLKGGSASAVTWRLVKRSGGYKIFDVNVDGIWLASTQKSNFTSVLKKNNGDISALLAYLRH
jgi:phospholipid transport system substrate-binding protein